LQTEAWAGHAAGTEEAIRVFGADCSYPLQLLSEILPQFIARAKSIYCDLGFLNPIVGELPQFQEAIRQGKVRSLNKYSQLVRWIKSSAELELMRQAAAITSKVCLGCHHPVFLFAHTGHWF
jgi:Xaa-Pro aminopeptidase